MIIVGVLCLLLGLIIGIRPLVLIGAILLCLALVLLCLGSLGTGYTYGWY